MLVKINLDESASRNQDSLLGLLPIQTVSVHGRPTELGTGKSFCFCLALDIITLCPSSPACDSIILFLILKLPSSKTKYTHTLVFLLYGEEVTFLYPLTDLSTGLLTFAKFGHKDAGAKVSILRDTYEYTQVKSYCIFKYAVRSIAVF